MLSSEGFPVMIVRKLFCVPASGFLVILLRLVNGFAIVKTGFKFHSQLLALMVTKIQGRNKLASSKLAMHSIQLCQFTKLA